MNSDLNWEWLKHFLAAAETLSLSKAAQKLGSSQATLTRQIQLLEQHTALNLFKRTNRGLELTDEGALLLEQAKTVQDSVFHMQRVLQGHEASLSGVVRVSVNEVVGQYMLPAALSEFKRKFPEIDVEVVITNRVSSLSSRETDIALRMFRPTQPDVIAARLPNLPLAFYASHSYLQEHGQPTQPEDLFNHAMIGFDQDMQFIEGARQLGFELKREDFAFRTDSLLTQIELMKSGAGVCATHRGVADHDTQLVEVLKSIPLPELEFWLVCHHDVEHNTRIRALMTFLKEWWQEDPYRKQ